jgi:hypothetical protein
MLIPGYSNFSHSESNKSQWYESGK